MAHKKGVGSSKNGRESESKRLGVKIFGGQAARAGNIIGGGDWAKDRIVTDIVESIEHKRDIVLRNPNAIRPWQHVIDVVNGYLKLAIYNSDKKDIFETLSDEIKNY